MRRLRSNMGPSHSLRELYAFPDRNNGIVPVGRALTAGHGSSTTTRNLTAWISKRVMTNPARARSTAKTVRTRIVATEYYDRVQAATSRRGNRTRAECCVTRR